MRRWWLTIMCSLLVMFAQAQPTPAGSVVQGRSTVLNELTIVVVEATMSATPVTPTRSVNHLPLVLRAGNTPTATRVPVTCAAEYPTICVPPPPPDLNCTDISFRNFTVRSPDRHRFDSDGDGIGCETT